MGSGTNLPVVELPVHVDLPLGDEARQVGDGMGDVWGTMKGDEPQNWGWLHGQAWDMAMPHAGGHQSSVAMGNGRWPEAEQEVTTPSLG